MDTINNIKCPNCGHEFPADEAFLHQAEDRIKAEYEAKIAQQAQVFNEQKKKLEQEKQTIEQLKKEQEEVVRKLLEKEREKLKSDTENMIREEYESQMKLLKEENHKRKLENKALKQKELELLQRENALRDKQEEFQLDMQKEMLRKRDEIAEEVRAKEREKNEMKFREYEKQLSDQKKLVEEMQRKAEQGSMQIQGEVLELALEDFLKAEYPYDTIEEVAKGQRGADVVQVVVNTAGQNCGKIIYESKRTKTFSDKWIEKLKNDQREQQADIAVIVTESMPKDMPRFGNKNRIWICTFKEVKGLSFVLREMLIRTQTVKASQENKTDKMELLYNYLISSEFAQRIEAIVEGFSDMKADIDKEKRAMQKIWKEREKQIEKVISNTIDMYGSIKGIAGKAIGTVKALELPGEIE